MTGSLSLRNHIVQISFNQMKTRSVLGCQHRHPLCPGGYLRAFCGAGSVKNQVARPKERASCFRLSSRWH